MSNRVKVEIYGQSYTLSGDVDEAYVQKLARYVDEKMRAVFRGGTNLWTPMRVAAARSRWQSLTNCTRGKTKPAIGTTPSANAPSSA